MGPGVGAFGVHRHADAGRAAAAVVIGDAGVGYGRSVEGGLSVAGVRLDGYEFIEFAAGEVLRGLNAPHGAEFGREELGDLRHGEVAVDGGGVTDGGVTDTSVSTGLGGLEDGEQGIGLAISGDVAGVGALGGEFLRHDVAGGVGRSGAFFNFFFA